MTVPVLASPIRVWRVAESATVAGCVDGREQLMTLKRPPVETPALYAQDGKGMEATVFAHYFVGSADWFITEYDPHEDIGFGWACLGDRQMAELGYVSVAELESVRVPLTINGQRTAAGLPVEYDEHWNRVTLREAIAHRDQVAGGYHGTP